MKYVPSWPLAATDEEQVEYVKSTCKKKKKRPLLFDPFIIDKHNKALHSTLPRLNKYLLGYSVTRLKINDI